MISHGAEYSKVPFTKSPLPAEPLCKMNRQQHRRLLKKMRMPFVRGPENRHDFASFEEKDSKSFLKFNPYTCAGEPNYPLFPHRDDVSLVDPCSGFMSPGADAELQPYSGRAIESLVDYSDVKPHQRVPASGERGQAAHRRRLIFLEETSRDRRWNSRAVPAASVRARLGGWRTLVEGASALPGQNHILAFHVNPTLKKSNDLSASWKEEKARNYLYSSSTQRGYEEVPWDNILPPKIQPLESTVEVMADPVSQYFTRKRYNSESELSQVVGGLWDRFQTRSFTSPQRPVVFVSPSSRTCHIPSYTGCVGAVNFEDIDNASVDLITLAHVRTSKPRYTNSAHTPNIPGYTGKVHWTATHPANSNVPSTTPSIIARMQGYIAEHGHSTQYNHQGPFSQMLTPVSPQNSFKKIPQQTIKV